MSKANPEHPTTHSVLVQRTVVFWERVDVEATTPEDAVELAQEEAGVYDWSNSHELDVSITAKRDGEVLAEVAYEDWPLASSMTRSQLPRCLTPRAPRRRA